MPAIEDEEIVKMKPVFLGDIPPPDFTCPEGGPDLTCHEVRWNDRSACYPLNNV
jgi:hypothetical protein